MHCVRDTSRRRLRLAMSLGIVFCGAIFCPVILCGVSQGQAARPLHGSPPPSISAAIMPLTTLPDANASLPTSTIFAGRSLHLLVGRSIFIKTPGLLKRVYVSNPAVLDSFSSSPSEIVVTAKTPGLSSLILWGQAGESTAYLVSCDVDVVNLQKEMQQALPGDSVLVSAQQDRISLSGIVWSTASAETAVKLAALYSKNVVNSLVLHQPHIPQVKLKVQIVEIDRSKLAEFGINLFSQGKNTSAVQTGQCPSVNTTTSTSTTGTVNPLSLSISSPLNLLFYNSGLNLGLTLQDLQNRQVLQILAEPTLTTISGQKAAFLSGGEFPFPVVQGSSGGLTSITIQFRPYGVKVEFTPIVNEDGTIQMKILPEVSALDYTNAVTISGYTIPAISTRRAETQVELRSGQSFAISGLLDRRTTDILSKMPGIGDVPILGQLFRSKNINHSVVELVVAVTPTVIDPLSDDTPPALPKFAVPLLDPKQFDRNQSKHQPETHPNLPTESPR